MFRKNKDNKAKLEHKMYLARETPEPVFDLSECGIKNVPQGIYSLCRVFLKETLQLECNNLSSLSGGGQLKDLCFLRVLNLRNNAFTSLPEDIHLLKNLRELYVNNNHLKKLPSSICTLTHLKVLNVANNALKSLPDDLGNLINLKILNVSGNKNLNALPKSMAKAQNLATLILDEENFIYPPKNIAQLEAQDIIKYICADTGITYAPPPEDVEEPKGSSERPGSFEEPDSFEKQKLQEFLEIEKANELAQKQEFEMASAQKVNREKLLADITHNQHKLDLELSKIQEQKETERFRLIEQIQEAELNADMAIKQLLSLSNEPLAQLLEQEKQEEKRLFTAANKYNETLRKTDVLADMQVILQQETKKFQQLQQNRVDISKSILEQELKSDVRLAEILLIQDTHKAELVSQLLEDIDLQKAAVGTLLERGDARSWGLVQQVRLVECQLAALTSIEMDKKKLEIDHQINDLAEKRINLSLLLLDLLEQQKERRHQLLSTLEVLGEYSYSTEDFWLKQYQRLLDKLPDGISEAQKNMDPALAQALLVNGVVNCLPFLAKLTQCQCDVENISDEDLIEAGVSNRADRVKILDAFQMYKKELMIKAPYRPSAPMPPSPPVEAASAPMPEHINSISTSECVICMDKECEIIYVPCGHLCCCIECSGPVTDCPMCRTSIERKIRIVTP